MRPTVLKLGGKNLPEGPLSALMETKVRERLQLAYEAEAKEKGVPLDQIEKANHLYIREISVMDTVHLVKPGFQRRYGGDGNYPADFPVRSNCSRSLMELTCCSLVCMCTNTGTRVHRQTSAGFM
ncbi:unnamed protein product [Ascophyllum nodosum]